eukprot:TRINITY_DN47631_c0_g1_i1.p1 TRINITY_DN47631_c0_g1~~TRINITY_DN47631_c0_g1_i1.p1  ORF type:complete len:920 (-),score=84.17 TRINITY_DN47631_c0_g1_i1:56-2773(-)
MAPLAKWTEVLSPCGDKVARRNILQNLEHDVRQALASRRRVSNVDARGLAGAITSLLSSKDSFLALAGSVALLTVLEDSAENCRIDEISALNDDSLIAGLCTWLGAEAPSVTAAATIRALCALISATSSTAVLGKEDRQSRPRKVASQLKVALHSHQRSLLVQEALAEGCCAVQSSAHASHQSSYLWGILWPLAVHPRDNVAAAAAVSLSSLTKYSRGTSESSRSRAGESTEDHGRVPTAEEAIVNACEEFERLFRPLPRTLLDSKLASSSASTISISQCARFLELARSLVQLGCSTVQAPGQRESREGRVAQAVESGTGLVLPLPSIFGAIDSVISAIFNDTSAIQGLLATSSCNSMGIGIILDRALELASTVVSVAGVAVLLQATRLRKWLLTIAECPLESLQKHIQYVCAFVLTTADVAPAVLLQESLLSKLIDRCVSSLRSAKEPAASSANPVSTSAVAPGKRKRDVAEASTASGQEGRRAPVCLQVVRSATVTLAKLIDMAAPALSTARVAAICEQVVHVFWLGLVAPSQGGAKGVGARAGSTGGQASAVGPCQLICRDAASVHALLDMIEALYRHRPGQVAGAVAPGITSACAALLDALILNRRCRRSALALDFDADVQRRALRVRDEVVAAAGRSFACPDLPRGSGSQHNIVIHWPELSSDSHITSPMGEINDERHDPDLSRRETLESAVDETPKASPIADSSTLLREVASPGENMTHTTTLGASSSAVAHTTSVTNASPKLPPSMPKGGVGDVHQRTPFGAVHAGSNLQTADVVKSVVHRDKDVCLDDASVDQVNNGCLSNADVPPIDKMAPPVVESTSQPASVELRTVEDEKKPLRGTSDSKCAEEQSSSDLRGAPSEDATATLSVPPAQPMELFPDGDDSPLPELCMDSPSSDEA